MNSSYNQFSAPMPFEREHIKLISKINEKHKKSKITTLYNCLPANAVDFSGFEQLRTYDDRVNSLNDLIDFVSYSKDMGFEFTYLMNSVNTPNPDIFKREQGRFRDFLEKLLKHNILNLRISNTLVSDYVMQNYPQFKLFGSTSQEYYSLKQYANYFQHFSTVDEIVPSWDVNKNFKLLRNFLLRFPNKSIELMVNEGCIAGCPFRRDHHASNVRIEPTTAEDRFVHFFSSSCGEISNKDKALYVCLSNIIYPWDISTYNKYGINKFKLIGRNSPDFKYDTKYLERYDVYLSGIEDIDSILDTPFIDLNHYTIFCHPLKDVKVREVIDYLPKIEYFEKNGHLCSSSCGAECDYCYNCAGNLKKEFSKRL